MVTMRFADYEPGDFFDEMFDAGRQARGPARALAQFIDTLPDGELLRRQRSAERGRSTSSSTTSTTSSPS